MSTYFELAMRVKPPGKPNQILSSTVGRWTEKRDG